jgi:hypothetical protein
MSKEQIEEMAKHCHFCEKSKCLLLGDEAVDCDMECDIFEFAKSLYNAGYRKQREGRWEKRVFVIFDSEKVGYRCSECNTTWDTQTPYCPKCGAKMKGGAE